MENETKDGWVCRASWLEEIYDAAHKKGTFMLVYQLSLSTVLPLQERDVRKALLHLRRNCPNLGLCFGKRNGETWFRKTENEDIDFEVVNDMSAREVMDTLQTYSYKSEKGPLWCARLQHDTKTDEYALDEGFPHTSQFFLGVIHAITDGTTMAIILGGFVKILEDVLAGKPISNKPVGKFVSDTRNEKLVSSKIEVIQNDPILLENLAAAENDKGVGMPLLLKVFPPPSGGEDRTDSLADVLDRCRTKRFIEKCKSEGVTVHSAFCAITNISTIKLLGRKGYTKESYRLCIAHMINLRRYWPDDTSKVLGLHAHLPFNMWTDVPKDVLEKGFWDYARALHQDIHGHLKNESSLWREAYLKHTIPDPSYDDIFHVPNPVQEDAVFTNLGDITSVLTEGGAHVRPYFLKRRISLHRTYVSSITFFLHTFRGRMIIQPQFNRKFFTLETIKQQFHEILNIIEQITTQ